GQVIACCLNDASRTLPTLALAQRLWDDPDELVHSFDPAHALLRHGLIGIGSDASSHDWQSSLAVPSLVASELLFGREQLPAAFAPIETIALPADFDRAAIARVAAAVAGDAASMRIVPVVGGVGAPLAEVAAACAQRAGVRTVRPSAGLPREHLGAAFAAAWLRGDAVYVPGSALATPGAHEGLLEMPPLPGLPLTVCVGVTDRGALRGLDATLPATAVPPLTYAERLACWREAVPTAGAALPELARRFRYEQSAIARVGSELATLGRAPSTSEMLAAA